MEWLPTYLVHELAKVQGLKEYWAQGPDYTPWTQEGVQEYNSTCFQRVEIPIYVYSMLSRHSPSTNFPNTSAIRRCKIFALKYNEPIEFAELAASLAASMAPYLLSRYMKIVKEHQLKTSLGQLQIATSGEHTSTSMLCWQEGLDHICIQLSC